MPRECREHAWDGYREMITVLSRNMGLQRHESTKATLEQQQSILWKSKVEIN